MKKSFLVLSLLLMVCFTAQAQFEYGVRFGASTQSVKGNELLLQSNTFDDLRVSLADASYGYHLGLYTQFKAFGLTISPELLFNSNSYEYRIQELNDVNTIEEVVTDRYQYIDIPVLVGLKLGPLRAYAGPEVHYFVNSYSNLLDRDGFSEQIDKVNYGAIVGAGLNVGKLRLDVRYEINFDDFEDHIFFDDNQLNFDSDDSRVIFSAGWRFN